MGSSAPTTHPIRPSLDAIGATASIACAVHCAAVALLLGGVPAASILAAVWVDWLFLAASLLVGLLALVPGYLRHRLRVPLALFVVGITILMTLRALRVPPSILELVLVLVAAGCLILAHWKNRGALHRCACGPRHH